MPEAYRQQFRNRRKRGEETFVEFAHEKSQLLDRWCKAKGAEDDFAKFREMILVEEMKDGMDADVRRYVEIGHGEILKDVATLADDFVLTQRSHRRVPVGNSSTAGSTEIRGPQAPPAR